MDQVMDIKKLNQLQFIGFLKDLYDVCEFIYNCFIILKYKYRRNVSNYLWLIIMSKGRH